MPVYRLPSEHIFPDPLMAEEDGLIAVGGDYHPHRMLIAYYMGIFPWFREDNTIYWFSPNPRMIVFPNKYKPSHGLRRLLNKQCFNTSMDLAFEDVIRQCATIERKHESGTWLNEDYIQAFLQLHRSGHAHSIECWHKGHLVGGLYGIAIGHGFTGESMFSKISGASKMAFHTLINFAKANQIKFIDAQQDTPYLRSLCGENITAGDFQTLLSEAYDDGPVVWQMNQNTDLP